MGANAIAAASASLENALKAGADPDAALASFQTAFAAGLAAINALLEDPHVLSNPHGERG